MSKILLTADVHLGVPGRLHDTLYALKVMEKYAISNKIDTIIILGDLFHDRRYLEIDVMTYAYRFFEDSKEKGIHWITFPGNHDMFLKHSWDINSLEALKKVITVIPNISLITLDDYRFWIVPFISYEKVYMDIIYNIQRESRKYYGSRDAENLDSILTHIGIHGATLNTCFMLKDWGSVSFAKLNFRQVFTGHFHCHQSIDNATYPGSPIAFKFDEGNVDHGFIVYDMKENLYTFECIDVLGAEYFPSEARPSGFLTVLPEDIGSFDHDDICNNNIRVMWVEEPTDNQKNDVKKHLQLLGAKSIRWLNVYQRQDKMTNVKKNTDIGFRNMFEGFIEQDTTKLKDLDKHLLLRLNTDIVTAGDEQYYAEQEFTD